LPEVLREAAGAADSFEDRFAAEVWLTDMSARLQRQVGDPEERMNILTRVHQEATFAGLAPELVLAVIEVESNFDHYAVSVAGAIGLMQIMPVTYKDINKANPHFSKLESPKWNIAAGIYYNRSIYRKIKNSPEQDKLYLTFAN